MTTSQLLIVVFVLILYAAMKVYEGRWKVAPGIFEHGYHLLLLLAEL